MGHGFNAVGRMCPPPRSLAAEANGCFMVRTPYGFNRIEDTPTLAGKPVLGSLLVEQAGTVLMP